MLQGKEIMPYKADICKKTFYRFLQEFWDVVIPEKPVYNWHIKYLCEELQYLNSFVVARKPKPYDLIINIPPGSTKSTIVTQMYNAWVWTIDPRQRFITTSYSHSLSLSHSIRTRDIILSDKYQEMFGLKLKADQKTKSDFRNEFGGQRFTTSTGGTVTGMHAHQILIDDPLNPQGAASDADRENANRFVSSTLSSRKIDKEVTPTILIMQRLHEADPTGMLLSKKGKKIKHICLPSELSENVKPKELKKYYVDGLLDPLRLNRKVLEEAKIDLGSYGYAGQHGQKPAPDEGGLIKKDWFDIIDWKPEFQNLTWNFTADTAYTEKESNDPSGYLSYAKYNNDYIVRFAATEFLEFPELCRALPAFCYLHGYSDKSLIEVEPKASGKSLVQTLSRETSLNITEGEPPSKDKVARVKDCSPKLESRRVKLIRGIWNKEFLDQVTTFPNALHDEYVDCLTIMLSEKREKVVYGSTTTVSSLGLF